MYKYNARRRVAITAFLIIFIRNQNQIQLHLQHRGDDSQHRYF